jgi:hypothetical protein
MVQGINIYVTSLIKTKLRGLKRDKTVIMAILRVYNCNLKDGRKSLHPSINTDISFTIRENNRL